MLMNKFYFMISVIFPIAIAEYSPKIIQGENAKEGQFPFMVSLKHYKDNIHHCGGSILTNKWVLTAGHCCYSREVPANNQFVFAGTIFLNGTGEAHGFDYYINHDGWAPDVFEDDLCLIKIKGEFQFNERLQPIVLPIQDWVIDDGQLANVTGWGRTATADSTPPNTLQVGYNFVVLSNEHCHNLTDITMYDGWLCAQGSFGGQGICFGDSGSPLHINGVQIGIVSFLNNSFCEKSIVAFYTRVPKYVNWIKEKLGSDAKYLKFAN